ncbi:LysR family transcriptional regulator [Tomitella biformata]|uniref:LysR family transcriptional regulator n=1 Tax=Tomitella biformata TaxID=630403 RepID=UPI000463F674|nr:LysR family transcriptional regulator [Tomitella biformata]
MDLRQLQYFLAIVDHAGMAGAATALGVTPPTISTSIRTMERSLGLQLFHRVGRGMVLSSAGHTLVGPARQILRDAIAAKNTLTSSPTSALVGQLDIMIFPLLGLSALAAALTDFRESHPSVLVRIKEFQDADQVVDLIRDGHCEFYLSHLPLSAADPLQSITLALHELRLVYPPGTDLPPGPITLSQLPDIPMLWVPNDSTVLSERIQQEVQRMGNIPHLAAVVEHREALLPFVAAGVGGTVVERAAAEALTNGCVVRPTIPVLNRAVGLTFDPDLLSPVARAFLAVVRERLDPDLN